MPKCYTIYYMVHESFNLAVKALLAQGVRSGVFDKRNSDEEVPKEVFSCLYRGPCGNKCFIGHLIDDEYYAPVFEHQSVAEPLVLYALVCSGHGSFAKYREGSLAEQCQEIHDYEPVESWRETYKALGEKYGLQLEF